MNSELEEKVKKIYKEAKNFAAKHQYAELMKNDPSNNVSAVWDEYARQIDYTNAFKQKKKDLEFLLALLTEYKNGISNNTPAGQRIIPQINAYIENIKTLIKVYIEIDEGQYWILNYYYKGGGCQW